MEYSLELKYMDGEDEVVVGTAVVNIPKFKERTALLKSINIKVDKDGNTTLGGKNDFDTFEKMIEITEKYTKQIDGKIGDHEIKDIESLMYFAVGAEIVSLISSTVLNGISLGKN